MNKKRISMMLAGLMMFSNATSAFAMSNEIDQQIQGNSLLIGNYLFELDKNANSFDLDSFITSARSIADGEDNEVYYKDASGSWYELVEDGSMSSAVSVGNIDNAITMRNGVAENTDPNVLAKSDLLVSPATIVESTTTPGTFDTEVTVTIKASNNAKFATNVGATVDSISSASLVRTAPAGTNMQITRVDDKSIKLKLTGTASNHAPSVNTTEGSADNQKDFNENGTFGDIKFLMLPAFFTGVNTVAEGGQYVVLDVQFNDGAVEDRILDVAKTKAIRVENVDYGVVVFTEGSIEDYTLTLNDAAIEPTKVNDSGSIVKFEMNSKEVAQVKVVKKDDATKTDTMNIGMGTQPFTTVVKDQDPDRVLISGPMSKFDYFLVDYDDNGVIRSELDKTTFDTENEGVKQVDPTVPKITVKESRLVMDDEWNNNVVLQVEDPSSVKSKKWLENIYDISKDYGKSAESRVPVQFTVDKVAGTITIISKSRALNERNGHHKVILKSNSFNDVAVEFELILEAGSIVKNTNYAWYANQELMFELHDFSYGVTNPIYEVWLDGEKLSKEGDNWDYYVISNIVTLYNDTKAKLTEGEHNLVIKVHGYEDFERPFTLKTAPDGLTNPSSKKSDAEEVSMLSVDAVSAASGSIGGSTGSGGSSSGGGGMMRANVIYDFDHIVNSYILLNLDMQTPYAKKTMDWWEKFTKDAIITDGSQLLMDYEYFADNSIDNGKKYPTFEAARAALIKENLEEHLKFNPDAKPDETPEFSILINDAYNKPDGLYVNRPYTVKNMMHDGEIGDLYYFGEVTAKDAADISVKGGQVLYGNDVVIEYTGSDEWAEALVSIKQNSAYMKFDVDTTANTVTLKNAENSFITGENKYEFSAPGFKSKSLKVEIYKAEQKNVTIKKDDSDNIIVEGFDKDFLSNIMGLSLAGKPLNNDSQVGNNGGQYEIRDTQLILRSSTFGEGVTQHPKNQQLTLMINAEGYDTFTKNFTVETSDAGVIEKMDVPSYVKLNEDNTYRINEPVLIDVEEVGVSVYNKDLKFFLITDDVTKEISTSDYKMDKNKFFSMSLNGELFNEAKDFKIRIQSENYKDIEFDITIIDPSINKLEIPDYVSFSQDGKTVDMGEKLILSFDDGQFFNVSDYASAIETIKIGESTYDVSLDKELYDISSKVKTGQNEILIIAKNYVNKSFTVKINEVASPAKLRLKDKVVDAKAHIINTPEDIEIDLGSNHENIYSGAITEISVEGSVLSDEEYTIGSKSSSKVLTIKSSNFDYDNTYKLTLKANGYSDVVFTIEVEAEGAAKFVPDTIKVMKHSVDVTSENIIFVEKQDQIFIHFGDETSEYITALEGDNGAIVINGTPIVTDGNTVSEVNWKDVAILDTSKVNETNYTIVLKAEGFKEKTFNVEIDSSLNEDVPDVVAIYKGYNNYVDEIEVTYGSNVEFIVDDSDTSDMYKNAIKEIEIKTGVNTTGAATTIKVREDVMNGSYVRVKSEDLPVGTNEVTIKAPGYKDYVGQITVLPIEYYYTVGIFDGNKNILSNNQATYESSQDVIIVIANDSYGDGKKYYDSIHSVRVNGVKIDDYSIETKTISYSSRKCFVIPSSYFDEGSTKTIEIEATNYKTAAFEITIQ